MKRIHLPSRFRPNFNWVKSVVFGLALVAAPFGDGASAQETTIELDPPILIIDQDRLFSETTLGTATRADIENQARKLAEENQTIEADLIAEERELTERRARLTPDAFRALADAFDAKVQTIRAEQDEKARDLNRSREEARGAFFQNVAGIISDIVRERGALVVMDRRDVFLSAERIDITDEAIRRVNASIEATSE